MSQRIYGAGSALWQRLAGTKLLPDLLPVVSNTDATISENSRMAALGKTPSWYNADRKVAGIANWTARQTERSETERWAKENDYGICIQTRQLRALDVDMEDPAISALIQEAIVDYLVSTGHTGLCPVRMRSNSGKLLVPVWCEGELYKRRFECKLGGGFVELLATGQQFIAYGTHPSGVRYEWQGAPEHAPTLTLEELDALWAALVKRFAVPDSDKRARATREGNGVHRPDIDDPVYQYLERNGHVLDFDEKKGHAHIVCPFEDQHSTHTLTSTTYMIRGGAGHDTGHFSCLHASCAGRHDSDFLNEIGYVAAQFDDEPVEERTPTLDELLPPPDAQETQGVTTASSDDWPTFFRNKNGEIEATIGDVVRALASQPMSGVRVAYDDFISKIVVDTGDGSFRRLADVDYTTMRIALERRGFKPIGRELIRDAVAFVADRAHINSAQLWLDSLKWDGVPRVRTFMRECYKVEGDAAYVEAVGVYLMTALAGRVLYPGCKVDMVPVLTSAQGMVKTSSVEALAPSSEAFGELDLGVSDDNVGRALAGKLVVEMPELKGLGQREIGHLRSLISRRFDEWVPKYQENPVRRPRTSVFIGTTNEYAMLIDREGNRRWLPCVVGDQIDIKCIKKDRDQLWAEGAVIVRERVAKGLDPVWWEEAHRLGKQVQKEHEAEDPLREAVVEWLASEKLEFGEAAGEPVLNGDTFFTINDISTRIHPSLTRGMSPDTVSKRIGSVLRSLDFENRNRRVSGEQAKRWGRRLL